MSFEDKYNEIKNLHKKDSSSSEMWSEFLQLVEKHIRDLEEENKLLALESVSSRCRRSHIQLCSICDDLSCIDNTSYVKKCLEVLYEKMFNSPFVCELCEMIKNDSFVNCSDEKRDCPTFQDFLDKFKQHNL